MAPNFEYHNLLISLEADFANWCVDVEYWAARVSNDKSLAWQGAKYSSSKDKVEFTTSNKTIFLNDLIRVSRNAACMNKEYLRAYDNLATLGNHQKVGCPYGLGGPMWDVPMTWDVPGKMLLWPGMSHVGCPYGCGMSLWPGMSHVLGCPMWDIPMAWDILFLMSGTSPHLNSGIYFINTKAVSWGEHSYSLLTVYEHDPDTHHDHWTR
ncbi:hypothetical protein C8R42DRAFT_646400 [Lentinula raphanica]|nr:hypothetical protein C8R42DRAFT_646400 [Lentinula raphanica]